MFQAPSLEGFGAAAPGKQYDFQRQPATMRCLLALTVCLLTLWERPSVLPALPATALL